MTSDNEETLVASSHMIKARITTDIDVEKLEASVKKAYELLKLDVIHRNSAEQIVRSALTSHFNVYVEIGNQETEIETSPELQSFADRFEVSVSEDGVKIGGQTVIGDMQGDGDD